VVSVVADRIRSGVYKPGDLLPTERALAADLQVHRRSVRIAIEQLASEGIVSHRPNCRPAVGQAVPPADEAKTLDREVRKSASRISTSNLVALIMWHGGGPLEHAGTSQQRIFWGMNQMLMKIGYHAVFLDLGGDHPGREEEVAAREAEHLRYVLDQRFGGALFYPYAYRHNAELVETVSRTVPLVLLDRKIAGVDADFVGIANQKAFFDVTDHLVALGHRRIAHVTRSEPIHSVQDRVQGYLDALRRDDQSGLTEMILTIPPYKDDRAWSVLDAVFRLPKEQRPTAVTCMSDYLAVSLSERLQNLGLSVPKDVAITGFDNIVPTLPNGAGMTTVAQPYEAIGTTAVELLLRRIKDPRAATMSIELPAQLIVRDSSTFQRG
jgi:GntR family transcriptional regulator of arabinose operon